MIIVVGIGLSLWNALDLPIVLVIASIFLPYELDNAFKTRFFLQNALDWFGAGFLVLMMTEIAARSSQFRRFRRRAGGNVNKPFDSQNRRRIIVTWNNVDMVAIGRLAGILVITAGILLSAWDVLDAPEQAFDASEKFRYFLENSLRFVGTGALIIVAAEVAARLGWHGQEGRHSDEGL